MSQKPVIFLSAVSRELKSARQLVADTLGSFGIEVEKMEIFNAPAGDLRDVLREKIDRCQAIIHFVGQHYGFEPPTHDDPLDPCSYTQYEARYAIKRRLKIWLLLLDTTYPPDNASTEGDRAKQLQQTWHLRIRGCGQVYDNIADARDVENRALRVAHEVNRTFGTAADSTDALAVLTAKVEQALARLPQEKTNAAQAAPDEDPAAIEARAYAMLEKKLGLKEGILAVELPRLAERLLQNPDTSHIERARALYVEKKYPEAEAAALQAKAEAISQPGFSAQDALAALRLAADCAREQFHYAQAIEHYRAAAVFTDPDRDPVEWANVQHMIAYALDDDGKYHDAEVILLRVIKVSEEALGTEHPETLSSRNNLANALDAQGKHAEAEQEHRAVLKLRERVLGAEHPDSLMSRMNLANALDAQGKHAEAEQEHRAVLKLKERVLGAEHPDTLASRNNLANTLNDQGKHAEAEQEHRAVLKLKERALGAEHPDILISRNNLGNALYGQDKYAEAEQEYRAVLKLRERVLGAEHPDTLKSRNNLATALQAQGKHAEAEQEHRAVLKLLERVLGAEHPDILSSRMNLAAVLYDQEKYAEAEQEHRAVLKIKERVLGATHPNIFQSCYNLALCLEAQGHLKEAFEFAQRAESGLQMTLGPNYPRSKDATRIRKRMEAELTRQKAGGK